MIRCDMFFSKTVLFIKEEKMDFEKLTRKWQKEFSLLGAQDPRLNPCNWEKLWPGAPARWVLKFLYSAIKASIDSTCLHRHTGATLVDIKEEPNGTLAPFEIISCFNGAPTGITPCTKLDYCRYRRMALNDFCKRHKLPSPLPKFSSEQKREFREFKEKYLMYCQAIHAEQNAIFYSPIRPWGKLLFATTNPCPVCARMIVQNNIHGVIYCKPYKTDFCGRPLLDKETKYLFKEAHTPCIYIPFPEGYLLWTEEEAKSAGEGIPDPLCD